MPRLGWGNYWPTGPCPSAWTHGCIHWQNKEMNRNDVLSWLRLGILFWSFLFHGMNFRHFLLVNVTHSVGISIFWERLSRIFSRVNEDRHHRVFTLGKPVANEVGQLPSAIFDGKLIKNRWVTTFGFLALVCQPFPLSCLGFAITCSVISKLFVDKVSGVSQWSWCTVSLGCGLLLCQEMLAALFGRFLSLCTPKFRHGLPPRFLMLLALHLDFLATWVARNWLGHRCFTYSSSWNVPVF